MPTPLASWRGVMAVRKAALARFDTDAVPQGQNLASLRRAFVPIWLLHRYQVEAAAKALGGVVAPNALAGDAVAVEPVAGSDPAGGSRRAFSTSCRSQN